MKDNNRYKVCWISEPIVNGFYSQHEAVVFGLDSVQHIIDNIVPKDQGWDVIPM